MIIVRIDRFIFTCFGKVVSGSLITNELSHLTTKYYNEILKTPKRARRLQYQLLEAFIRNLGINNRLKGDKTWGVSMITEKLC
jgi:hypothetical protein